jgi:hypothetical protein
VLVGGGDAASVRSAAWRASGTSTSPITASASAASRPGGLVGRRPPVGDLERLAQEGLDERRAGLRRQGTV